MRVQVSRDACCGSGNCVRTVPDVFDQDDRDGVVVLLNLDPPVELHELIRQAKNLCPAGAITVVEG